MGEGGQAVVSWGWVVPKTPSYLVRCDKASSANEAAMLLSVCRCVALLPSDLFFGVSHMELSESGALIIYGGFE